MLLLAPSCCTAFASSLPEEIFVATEGKRGHRGDKGIKLGKMKTKHRQVCVVVVVVVVVYSPIGGWARG